MMVEWENDGSLQANDDEIRVNDGEWSYIHFNIINEHFTIISLKLTPICSSDHHWEAEPTGIRE